jgi:hypothetical protein
MKVKIGDTWYDSDDQPICVQVDETERSEIAGMVLSPAKNGSKKYGRYGRFPESDTTTTEQKHHWMSV